MTFVKLNNRRKRLLAKMQVTFEMIEQLPENEEIFMARADALPNIYTEYDDILGELDDLEAPSTQLQLDINSLSADFDHLYYAIQAEAEKMRVRNRSSIVTIPPPTTERPTASRIKLPPVNIKKFNGKIEEFSAFIGMFDTLIHACEDLTDIERFTYLLSYLEGEPLRLIQTVTYAPDNYITAYDILKGHYTNKRLLASHYLNKILSIPALKSNSPSHIHEFVDLIDANVTALKKLDIPNLSDFFFLHVCLRPLDFQTRKKFEEDFVEKTFPSFKELISHLNAQCTVSNLMANNSAYGQPVRVQSNNVRERRRALVATQNSKSKDNEISSNKPPPLPKTQSPARCPCKIGGHRFGKCTAFLQASPAERLRQCNEFKRCRSCLGLHEIRECLSTGNCQHCGEKSHHTLLHEILGKLTSYPKSTPHPSNSISPSTSHSQTQPAHMSLTNYHQSDQSSSLVPILGTVQVRIFDSIGKFHFCRAVIDPGSQSNFISMELADQLGLPRTKCPFEILGVGQSPVNSVRGIITCQLASSLSTDVILSIEAAVVPKITSNLPTSPLSDDLLQQFASLNLADPHFNKPAPIHLLLGVQAFIDLTPTNPLILKGQPSAFLTKLGWVLMGSAPCSPSFLLTSLLAECHEHQPLDKTLQAFWEQEEIPSSIPLSPDEIYCEKHFSDTISRDPSGRYIARLPFRDGQRPSLGSIRQRALSRLHRLESRFHKDHEYYKLYCDNLKDYVNQGHMVVATHSSDYIMTHHGVIKSSPTEKKIRVVFSPAEKDSHGVSLNDCLLTGPKLVPDIGKIVTQFRTFKIALTCDIKQMYREILLHEDDCTYQHIFWRFSTSDPITEWEIRRVTFGVSSSPYLAQKTIKQLAIDEGGVYPLATRAINDSIYVDDFLTGANSEQEAFQLRDELINLLKKGGFELGKWASSSRFLLENPPSDPKEFSPSSSAVGIKVLGLWWDPRSDVFLYRIDNSSEPPTKRTILSRVARTYDFNGYLGPVIFLMKTLLQQLWKSQIGLDEPLPVHILESWNAILAELPLLESISIPRYILSDSWHDAQLIGFSDGSLLGMGAVLYLRIETGNDIYTHILKSKTKVAPLKPWTIPRLELGAACLLAKLIKNTLPISSSLNVKQVVCFCDSTTVLGWIQTPPHMLKMFVANRVVQIHDDCPNAIWRYVPSEHNSADPASRGLLPSKLIASSLWWNGPEFLTQTKDSWPPPKNVKLSDLPEIQPAIEVSLTSTSDNESFTIVMERNSSLLKCQRIIVYVVRFLFNIKMKLHKLGRHEWLLGSITAAEYQESLQFLIEISQQHHYAIDISALRKGKPCSKKLWPLSPFVTSTGFLRVGGRLRHSTLPYSSKHPYLIHHKSRLASLLCDHYHRYSGHGGPRLVQSLIQRTYWIPSIRSLLRQRIFRCLVCYKDSAKPSQPPMADLPAHRVTPSRCFSHTGIDFGGPFSVRVGSVRNSRTQRAYIALFVCMATKAVHIEVVTALTEEACLAALDRFIARRGLPSHIYSDQGRNFRGAARELDDITRFLNDKSPVITNYLAQREVSWIFNPPYSPNFGGIWEGGIKSTKKHLRRIVGVQRLTLEELMTITSRIEAILNSRPLASLSISPSDCFDVLTPGHFLIGAPLLARPENSLLDVAENRLSRWQLVRKMVQCFWRTWMREYIHTQLNQPKWFQPAQPFKIGDLVLWHQPQTPPTQWPLGRIVQLLPGRDGVNRVMRIKSTTGMVMRPTSKVVLLPIS